MGACTGTRTCNGSGRWGACVIAAIETCDGTDSDCNGVIDDGSAICEVATGCDQVRLASGVYLLCYQKPGSDRRRGWTAARDYCASFGYHLVTIDDGAENSALMSAAMARVDGDWWIGINDEDGDSMFSWVSGRSRFEAWRMDEPDRGECGVIDTAENDWESKGCGGSRGFICEAPGP